MAAPTTSRPTPDHAVAPVSSVLDFDAYDWKKLVRGFVAELNGFTKDTFAWSFAKVWQFTCGKELVLGDYSSYYWSNPLMVKAELNRKGAPVRKAAVVLRWQAKAGDRQDHSSVAPLLVNDLKKWFTTAAKITDQCGGLKFEEQKSWADWGAACWYFDAEVYRREEICRALGKQYGSEWEELENLWESIEQKWLPAP